MKKKRNKTYAFGTQNPRLKSLKRGFYNIGKKYSLFKKRFHYFLIEKNDYITFETKP